MGPRLTVSDFISALQSYAKSAPAAGAAQIVLRSPDGETCFPHFSALNGDGVPGQNFLVLAPMHFGNFRMVEAMKIN